MSFASLPQDLRGEWIWQEAGLTSMDCYVFFRREFSLADIPTAAKLWIASQTNHHVYVNGRHVGRGPLPASAGKAGVNLHEIAHFLEYGRNVIAVVAHNVRVSRYGNVCKPGGLWCQLNVDGQPAVWSDASWQAKAADCYLPRRPRIDSASGFVEAVDLRRFPRGWNDNKIEFAAGGWAPAARVAPGRGGAGAVQLLPTPEVERVSECSNILSLIAHGTFERNRAMTHVLFSKGALQPGVYAAECYIHSAEAGADLGFQFVTDDPAYLYVNHELVFSQGTREPRQCVDPTWNAPRGCGQDHLAEMAGTLNIKPGANHVLLVQQVGDNSAGATLIFPEVEEGAFKFARGQDAIGMPGWTLYGPLHLPFAHVQEPLNLSLLPQDGFFGQEPTDQAAALLGHTFTVTETIEEGVPFDEVDLSTGQYLVLELERYTRGCLELDLQGTAGDTLDVVYGDVRDGHIVNPFRDRVRKLYTVVLADGAQTWQALTPHGLRFVMIVCRHVSGKLVLTRAGIRRQVLRVREPASFVCADELLNQIWATGVTTLEATYDSVFLNASGHQESQYLADAMLQSFASFSVLGGMDFSEKALREFAAAQYENGEIPAMVPSDYAVRLLDSMMLWPVWLQRHIQWSGNQELLRQMLPHLERLLIFLEGQSGDDSVLLGNQEPPFENACVLDYDETIDRRGLSTGLNALYCYALLKAEWLFSRADQQEFARYCTRLATEVAKAVRATTWDENKGLFADGWYDGKRSDSYSLQTNVLAMLSGIADSQKSQAMFDKLFIEYAPFHKIKIDNQNENPYFKYFILEMAYALGHRDWATDYMRYYWGGMIQKGATTWWEKFSPELEGDNPMSASRCHGYGVAANYFLIAEVMGVRPAEPGCGQLYFGPDLQGLGHATAVIPTAKGWVKFDWQLGEGGELNIGIKSDYKCEVVPQLDEQIAANAVVKVGDNVTVLK